MPIRYRRDAAAPLALVSSPAPSYRENACSDQAAPMRNQMASRRAGTAPHSSSGLATAIRRQGGLSPVLTRLMRTNRIRASRPQITNVGLLTGSRHSRPALGGGCAGGLAHPRDADHADRRHAIALTRNARRWRPRSLATQRSLPHLISGAGDCSRDRRYDGRSRDRAMASLEAASSRPGLHDLVPHAHGRQARVVMSLPIVITWNHTSPCSPDTSGRRSLLKADLRPIVRIYCCGARGALALRQAATDLRRIIGRYDACSRGDQDRLTQAIRSLRPPDPHNSREWRRYRDSGLVQDYLCDIGLAIAISPPS